MNLYIYSKTNIVKNDIKYRYCCFIILLLFSLVLITCSKEEKQAYYATLQEARQDRAFETWIPSVIPKSAVNIYERHFVDLNYVWLKFSMNLDELPIFSANLKKLSLDEVRTLSEKIWGVPEWWPKLLMSKKIKKASEPFPFIVAKYNYDVDYGNNKKQNMYGYFFINIQTGEAYYIGGYEN